MRPLSRSPLRRLGALLLLPATLVLGACGAQNDITIHDDMADVATLIWDSDDTMVESDCSEEGMGLSSSDTPKNTTYTFTEYEGHPACRMEATDVPLSEFSSEDTIQITHIDGAYEVVISVEGFSDMAVMYSDVEISYSVTFPGKVTEYTGDAVVDGNTVTWTDVIDETEDLRAVGKDSSFNPLLLMIGAIVGLVVIGGVVAIIVVSRKKKGVRPVPPGGVPGQPGYQAQQPGYSAQPGYQAQQPGYSAQPGYQAQQPGYSAQPGYQAQQPGYSAQPGYQAQQPGYSAQPGPYPQPDQYPSSPQQPPSPGSQY